MADEFTNDSQSSSPGPFGASAQQPNAPVAPAQSNAPSAPAVNPAVVHQTMHDAFIGRAAKALLGTQNQYSVDPQTGRTIATPVKETPGQLFRSLVAGALLGGAASAANPSKSGFLGGFATGGNAVRENVQAQDERRRAQAQEEFRNIQSTEARGMERQRLDLEQQRFQQEKIFQQAQTAMWTANALRADHEAALQDEKFLAEQNQFHTNLQLKMTELGAIETPIIVDGKNINGQTGNGKELQAWASDPNNRKTPEGYLRLPVQTFNLEGIHQDPKTRDWLDEKNNPVNLHGRAVWHIYDIPQNTLNKPVTITGAEANKLAGTSYKADTKITMSGQEYLSLSTQALERHVKDAAEARKEKHDELIGAYDSAKVTVQSLESQLRTIKQANSEAPTKDLEDQLDDARKQMDAVFRELNPKAAAAMDKAKAEAEKHKGEKLNPSVLQSKAPWAQIDPGKVAVFDQNGDFKGQALPGKAPAGMIEIARPGSQQPAAPKEASPEPDFSQAAG